MLPRFDLLGRGLRLAARALRRKMWGSPSKDVRWSVRFAERRLWLHDHVRLCSRADVLRRYVLHAGLRWQDVRHERRLRPHVHDMRNRNESMQLRRGVLLERILLHTGSSTSSARFVCRRRLQLNWRFRSFQEIQPVLV